MSVITPTHKFKAEDVIKSGRTTRTNIEEIRKWVTLSANIPEMSDEQIALFLMACNNVTEDTETTISCYFKYKAAAPEIFSNRDMDSKELQFNFGVTKFAVFPSRTKENYSIAMGSLRDTYYYNYHLDQQIKVVFMLMDLALNHKDPPHGFIFIIDIKGVGLMHVTRLKISVVKKFFQFLQEALPAQLKQIHIINANYVFDKLLLICKPFMKKELFDLLIVHPTNYNIDEFMENHLPADCMPADFGGNLPDLDKLSYKTMEELRQMKTFFEMDQKQIDLYKARK